LAVILITGMSGTGKSAALGQLRERGYAAVDTDTGGWIELVPAPGGGAERQWREDLIDALITGHERSGPPPPA
jgi:predicted ATPase